MSMCLRRLAVLLQLFVLGGFDGYKWLSDLNVLDVGKLEETAITTQAVSSLLYDLRSLVNNRDSFPDIVFVVEGKEVFAHKALLCCRSRHFRAMFNSGACGGHALFAHKCD